MANRDGNKLGSIIKFLKAVDQHILIFFRLAGVNGSKNLLEILLARINDAFKDNIDEKGLDDLHWDNLKWNMANDATLFLQNYVPRDGSIRNIENLIRFLQDYRDSLAKDNNKLNLDLTDMHPSWHNFFNDLITQDTQSNLDLSTCLSHDKEGGCIEISHNEENIKNVIKFPQDYGDSLGKDNNKFDLDLIDIDPSWHNFFNDLITQEYESKWGLCTCLSHNKYGSSIERYHNQEEFQQYVLSHIGKKTNEINLDTSSLNFASKRCLDDIDNSRSKYSRKEREEREKQSDYQSEWVEGRIPFSNNEPICQSVLETHLRTQTREIPWQGRHFGKTFNCIGNLTNHMQTHTRKILWQCEPCGKTFAKKGNLKKHMLTHTRERPWACGLYENIHRKT